MPTSASQGHFSHGDFRQQSSRAPLVAGLGAALVASFVTVALMTSNGAPVAAPQPAAIATATTQCQVIQRKLLVSTETGGGTVRLRAGGYLSPPITLSKTPQEVVFPEPRLATGFAEQVITVEGNASNVVMVSALTGRRWEVDVTGLAAIDMRWLPMKPC
jgi:hypothetical protein